MSKPKNTVYVNNSFSFYKSVYYFYIPFNADCQHQFFTWIALGDVDMSIHFLPMLGRKAHAVEEPT